MAGNHLTLHTNDKVVVTTSRGNQEKWFDAEKNLWYKVDDGCFEALAEAVSSEVLRNFTNAVQLPGISVANYWVDTAEVHGLKRVVSVSENFKREDGSLVSVGAALLRPGAETGCSRPEYPPPGCRKGRRACPQVPA